MDLQTRNLAVFVICLTSLVFFGNAQQMPKASVEKTFNNGENVTLSCVMTTDINSFDVCTWDYINVETEDPDFLGSLKTPNTENVIDTRRAITKEVNSGECILTILSVQFSDAKQYSCTILDLNGKRSAHASYNLIVRDSPATFKIISDQTSYTKDDTKYVEKIGEGVTLDCQAGPSKTPATLEWQFVPRPNGMSEPVPEEMGSEAGKTAKLTAMFSLNKDQTDIKATCIATHEGYNGGQKRITLTVKLGTDPSPPSPSPDGASMYTNSLMFTVFSALVLYCLL